MTRSYASSRRHRITQPMPVAPAHPTRVPARDARFERLGFRCFRLVPTGDRHAPFVPLELAHGTTTMFILARALR